MKYLVLQSPLTRRELFLHILGLMASIMASIMAVSLCLGLSHALAQSAECVQVAKLYQSALTQYQGVAGQYLKAGCQEAGNQNEKCRGLEVASREMLATVNMFSMRGQALKCKVSDAQEKPQNNCDRLQSLAQRSEEKLRVLNDQLEAQRCQERAYAPPCKALTEATKHPREVVKAIRREAFKAGCKLP